MSELGDLYQEVILDHNKQPGATSSAEGYNPLCGDHLTVYLKVEDGVIRDISFEGSGCAISKASASLMTTSVKGKSAADAAKLFEDFHKLVTGTDRSADAPALGKLAVFAGVREFPTRVKCASLAWHTLHAALEGRQQAVATE
jgi:nitrogen fixation NifU-like protein